MRKSGIVAILGALVIEHVAVHVGPSGPERGAVGYFRLQENKIQQPRINSAVGAESDVRMPMEQLIFISWQEKARR